ncbi:hypothetical protein IIV22_010R [Invertebrate iridescent virus 22]|uniref:Uncharacterized protein n=1 Tax=Invertebrate iridescent virus 22 TaxID=345198 RepID=S6DCX4_9VIRU|nr:hypothetical protein IIV22_010R [Invertebrate iridescent virus 22]CCV01687.1 hypothetical protein IIV22_010R [Invertebrate iridescent virus 22]
MSQTIEKKFNVWSIQEQLYNNSVVNKQLDLKLKVLRDQYIESLINNSINLIKDQEEPKNRDKKNKGQNKQKNKCIIL